MNETITLFTSAFGEMTTPSPLEGSNDTGNSTPSSAMTDFYKNEQISFLVVLLVLIVVANSCLLLAIQLSKTKTRMNFFIMQLAIADLLVGLVVVSSDLAQKISVNWYGGDATCKMVQFLKVLVTYASTYVLVSLSIDRLDAIARPLKFSGSGRRSKMLILLAWGTSLLFSMPQLFLYGMKLMRGSWGCTIPLFHGRSALMKWKVYFVLTFVTIFFIPTVIIITCYVVIVYVVWTKSKGLGATMPSNVNRRSTNRAENGVVRKSGDSSSSSGGVIPQAKIRTIKMTLVIVIAFILCWTPYFLFNLLDLFYRFERTPTNMKIRILFQSFAPLNSAANPLIYGLFSSRICRNLRRIRICNWLIERLCCCCDNMQMASRGSTNSSYPNTIYTSVTDGGGRTNASVRYRADVITSQQTMQLRPLTAQQSMDDEKLVDKDIESSKM